MLSFISGMYYTLLWFFNFEFSYFNITYATQHVPQNFYLMCKHLILEYKHTHSQIILEYLIHYVSMYILLPFDTKHFKWFHSWNFWYIHMAEAAIISKIQHVWLCLKYHLQEAKVSRIKRFEELSERGRIRNLCTSNENSESYISTRESDSRE